VAGEGGPVLDTFVNSTVITVNAARGREANRLIREIITDGGTLYEVNAELEDEGIANAFINIGDFAMLARGRDSGGNFWGINLRCPVTPEVIGGTLQVSDRFVAFAIAERAEFDILGAAVIMELVCIKTGGRNNAETARSIAAALLTTNRGGAVDFHMDGGFDFEMVLFIASESDPRGYEILSTNVIFDERR
jgi:hypothetical protein